MTELSQDIAAAIVIVVSVSIAGWGFATSWGSAVRGPAWGVSFIGVGQRAWSALIVAGLIAMFVVEPFWLGLAVAYLAVTAWWIGSLVRRRTSALLVIGGTGAVQPDRQAQVLRWVGYGLLSVALGIGYAGNVAFGRLPVAASTSMLLAGAGLIVAILLLFRARNVGQSTDPKSSEKTQLGR